MRWLFPLAFLVACNDRVDRVDVSPDAPAIPVDVASPPACEAWTDLQIGSATDDELLGLATDAGGTIYAAGFERGTLGVTNIEPDGDSRGVLLAFDTGGHQRWRAELDTPGSDTLEDVAIAGDRLVTIGRTSGAFPAFANHGQFDTVLATFDTNGARLDLAQSGDERPQHPARVAVTNDRIAVAGYDDTYVEGNAVLARDDGFLASFDRALAPRFLTKVANESLNRLTGVVFDADGNMYTASFATGRPNAGMHVEKLDPDGNVVWTTALDQVQDDLATAIAIAPSGQLVVAGATLASLAGRNAGFQDAFVMQLDRATGAIAWTAQHGSTESETATALAFDADGNIYIAGETLGGIDGATNQGSIDVFVMKLASDGTYLGSWQHGTSGADFATSIVVDRCGHALVGGYTPGAFVDGVTPRGFDMYLVTARMDASR